MTLHTALQQLLNSSQTKFPPEALQIIREADAELEASGIEKRALSVGEKLPDAVLTSANGDRVSIGQLNHGRPLILSFYRGGWCPYCNLELRAYQDVLCDIHELGGELVAVSPQTPDDSLSTAEKNEIAFTVLSDVGNTFARSLGIVFELPVGLQKLFASSGMNLPELNAETGWTLPIPATYVIDANGKVVLADVDHRYTRRLEPSDAVAALKSCVNGAGTKQPKRLRFFARN